MKENRTQARFEVCLTARWQGSPTNHNVRISDLSGRGCYFDTIAEVIVGEAMLIKILRPDGGWLELQGVVAHRTPRLGFGVCFVNLSEKQQHQIHALLRLQNTSPVVSADRLAPLDLIPVEQIEFTSRTIT